MENIPVKLEALSHTLLCVGVSLHLRSVPHLRIQTSCLHIPSVAPQTETFLSESTPPLRSSSGLQVQETEESGVHPWFTRGLKAGLCCL